MPVLLLYTIIEKIFKITSAKADGKIVIIPTISGGANILRDSKTLDIVAHLNQLINEFPV